MRVQHLLFFVIAPVIFLFSCGSEKNKFTITGNITNMPAQNIYLEELNINDIVILDSQKYNGNGSFKLSGSAPESGLYRLRFDENKFVLLSIDNSNVDVKGDWQALENYTVSGSSSSESLRKFLLAVRNHLRDFNTMSVVIDTFESRGNDSMLTKAKTDLQEMNMNFTRFIEVYSDTTKYLPNALFAARMLNPMVERQYLDAFVTNLPGRFPNAKMAKDFAADYNRLKAAQGAQQQQQAPAGPAIGSAAPELILTTPDGKDVSLASFKGKYVLVDFWASWCRPCRAENPNVVAAYSKFKDKNFTVLGVSLDDNKDKWTSAIEDDKLTWTHISDLKGWESVAARNYDVQSIPSNFLVDPDGLIIARDLHGADLETTLAGILK
ncbi:TlpA disulfide reductase family protein [Polluticoccus soli]|uniref:TlpA disulfide reductase family protein n=1 Tax=Polluticoccus soli TaxID=3034150 RepID=UPI0023E183AF|nr:TlpA disulfide reductase family protein [Flavipsychrobacter sp. JY13-12]